MEPQEYDQFEPGTYAMEQRLIALKNVYAENVDQRHDQKHTYGIGIAHALKTRKKIAVSPEDRYHLIAMEAYDRAKRDHFDAGTLVQHWIDAQAKIDRMLQGDEPEAPRPHHDGTLHGHE